MKLIIDIPKENYEYIKTVSDRGWLTSPEYANAIRLNASEFANVIKNGTPLDIIDELEKVSGKTIQEMLACFASDYEDAAFQCDVCPLRLKGICAPEHPGITCYELWLNYLKNNC